VVVALRTGAGALAFVVGFLCDTDALLCVYKLDDQSNPEHLAIVEGTTGQLQGTGFQIDLTALGTAALLDDSGGPQPIQAPTLPPHSLP